MYKWLHFMYSNTKLIMAKFPQFDFYSKIKDIYIEIHNYTFYHNPDEGSVENARFIGRKRQVERLEMMLTQSESKSGAYLITGYRGMGKTSLVNQTLAHIKRAQSGLPSFGRFLRWYGILAFISIFVISPFGNDYVIAVCLSILLLISLWLINNMHPERKDYKLPRQFQWKWFEKVFNGILNFLEKSPKREWFKKRLIKGLDFLEQLLSTLKGLFNFDLIARERRTTRVILQDISLICIIAILFIAFSFIFSSFYNDLNDRLVSTAKINFTFLIHLLVAIFFRKGLSKIYKLKKHFFPPSLYKNADKIKDSRIDIIKQKEASIWIVVFKFLYFVGVATVYFLPYLRFNSKYTVLFTTLIIFVIVIFIIGGMYYLTSSVRNVKEIKENGILKQLSHQINYGNFVPVRINLGQDELKEIDILSLVAKNTQQTYKKWSFDIFFSPRQFVGNAVYYALITAITALVFYSSSSYGVTKLWREKSDFCQYFPSQAVIDMDSTVSQDSMKRVIYKNSLGSPFDYPFRIRSSWERISDTFIINTPIVKDYNSVNTLANYMLADSGRIKNTEDFIYSINNKFFEGKDHINLISYDTNKQDTFKSVNNAIKTALLAFQADLINKKADKKDINSSDLDSLNKLLTPSVFERPHAQIRVNIDTSFKNSNYQYQLLALFDNTVNAQKASPLRQFCIGTDMFIQTSYNRFKKHFTNGVLPEKAFISFILPNQKDNKHGFIPPFLDYWFIILLIFVFLIVDIISRFSYVIGIRTPRYVISLLDELVENIDAQVLTEKTGQVPTMNTSGSRVAWFSFRRQRTIPRLDAKAIENQLIYIMDEIDRIPNFVVKPKFIFIFDELDKIEPYFNPSVAAKEKEDVENVRIEGSRMRQELVVKILGNLKHFLSTAKSKFIFIAGREMFDAALADASDREAYISSIFSDVLEVPSFYSDDSDNRISDITSLTEQFVCNYLIPRPLRYKYDCSLKGYNRYLREQIFTQSDKKLMDEQRQKIMLTLFNFITYLAYRSNGAPKKIAMLFEKHLVVPEKHQINADNNKNLTVRQFNSDLYFKFDEADQYRFGFTTYLFTPFLMKIGTHVYEMGDKLLVSTSFLLDHLYKYHPYGFSWRNLELTPEIIAINKSPHLRDFITDIINSLSQNHIREIISGLHDFKFNQKIAAEIRYISSISEPESAAFNFTLDESLQIKRYYKKRLLDLKRNYVGKDLKDSQHIHTISFLHMVLGDLHFYDQEYDDATLQYLDAIQLLRTSKGKEISAGNLVLLTRNMLKLGLTFERKRAYESALTYYGQMDMIINSAREVLLESFGLQEFVIKKSEVKEFVEKSYQDLINNGAFINSIKKAMKKDYPNDDVLSVRKMITVIKNTYFVDDNGNNTNIAYLFGRKVNPTVKDEITIERTNGKRNKEKKEQEISSSGYKNMKHFIGFTKDFFEHHFNNLSFSPELQSVFYKSSLQEELRILYQPLIARLQILEKEGMQGITQIDLERAEREFQYLSKAFTKDQKFMLEAEYNNKMGDILFYKNGYLKEKDIKEDFKSVEDKDKDKDKKDFAVTINESNAFINDIFEDKTRGKIYKPISAYKKYMKGCILILKYGFKIKEFDEFFNNGSIKDNFLAQGWDLEILIAAAIRDIKRTVLFKNNHPLHEYSDATVMALAYSIIDIADCILSFAGNDVDKGKLDNEEDRSNFGERLLNMNYLRTILEDKDADATKNEDKEYSPLDQVVFFYYSASQLFKSIGNFNAANSQRLKILYLLNDYINTIQRKDKGGKVNKTFEEESSKWMKDLSLLDLIKSRLVEHPIRYSYRVYSNSNRPEIMKLRDALDSPFKYEDYSKLGAKDAFFKQIYRDASVSADGMEFILMYEIFKMSLLEKDEMPTFLSTALHTPTKNNTRLLMLKLKTKHNYFILEKNKLKNYSYLLKVSNSIKLNKSVILTTNTPTINNLSQERINVIKAFKINKNVFKRFFKINFLEKTVKNNTTINVNSFAYLESLISRTKSNTYIFRERQYSISDIFDALKLEDKDFNADTHREENKKARKTIFNLFFSVSKDDTYQLNSGKIDLFTEGCKKIDVKPLLAVIVDSMYCFLELTKAYEIYGTNYISSFPTVQASAHRKLAFWCRLFYLVEEGVSQFDDEKDEERGKQLIGNAKQDLRDLLGYDDLHFIYHGYHYEKTVECYDKAISTHTEGKAFFQFIEKMYYLDDDFNDDIVHFNIALERYRINTGHIHDVRRNLIDNHLNHNYLYDYDTYMEK